MKSLLVQCPWLQPTEILMSVTEIVSVEIIGRLLLSCGPAQVSVLPTLSLVLSSHLHQLFSGLSHLVSPFTTFLGYTLLSFSFKWLNLFSAFLYPGVWRLNGNVPQALDPSSNSEQDVKLLLLPPVGSLMIKNRTE